MCCRPVNTLQQYSYRDLCGAIIRCLYYNTLRFQFVSHHRCTQKTRSVSSLRTRGVSTRELNAALTCSQVLWIVLPGPARHLPTARCPATPGHPCSEPVLHFPCSGAFNKRFCCAFARPPFPPPTLVPCFPLLSIGQPCYTKGCASRAIHGWEDNNTNTVSSCVFHKKPGMTQMRGASCEFPQCQANPSYALRVRLDL